MDNNYFDFLGQNSVAGNDDSNAGASNDKGKVNLTVRVDADCQVVCDGDFLFLANANQIVKDMAPKGQHIFNFTSLDYPEATVEKIVDFPVEGNNYLIVVNELAEKVAQFKNEKQQQQNEKERIVELEKAMSFHKDGDYLSALKLFQKHIDSLNSEELAAFDECSKKKEAEEQREYEKTHDIEITVKGVSFKMIYVKGGTFTMGDGSHRDNPAHDVTLSDYHIGETQVTQALWKAVMGDNPSHFRGDDLPVDSVSWNDCLRFVEKLNDITGRCFWLPTEAQWEYAARGGMLSKGYKYSGSDNIDIVAWNSDNSNHKTHPVKTKESNELGLYDMIGNVEEWCHDMYDSHYYSVGSQTDPQGPDISSHDSFNRVCRGGGFNSSVTPSTDRCSRGFYYEDRDRGLRLVTVQEEMKEKLTLYWELGRNHALKCAMHSYEEDPCGSPLSPFLPPQTIFDDLYYWLNDEQLNAYKNCKKRVEEYERMKSDLEKVVNLWNEADSKNWTNQELNSRDVRIFRLNKYLEIKKLLIKYEPFNDDVSWFDTNKGINYKSGWYAGVFEESKRLINVLL